MVSRTHKGWGHWRCAVGSKPSWPIQGIDRQKDSLGSQKKHGEAMKSGDLVRQKRRNANGEIWTIIGVVLTMKDWEAIGDVAIVFFADGETSYEQAWSLEVFGE